jgi:hypothetical protein
MYTVGISGVGGRNVTAEASIAKFAVTSANAGKHVKATVWHAYMNGYSYNWGIDGSPMRYLPNCGYMTFAIEVSGPSTYGWMTCKLYVH